MTLFLFQLKEDSPVHQLDVPTTDTVIELNGKLLRYSGGGNDGSIFYDPNDPENVDSAWYFFHGDRLPRLLCVDELGGCETIEERFLEDEEDFLPEEILVFSPQQDRLVAIYSNDNQW